MGVTDTTEHIIELLPGQDEPFKERFCWIAPHNVEEVRRHIQEMLDGGVIRPSQSPWCNAICISAEEGWHPMILHRLSTIECQDKERLIPDTERPGDNGILSGCQIFLHHGPQEQVFCR